MSGEQSRLFFFLLLVTGRDNPISLIVERAHILFFLGSLIFSDLGEKCTTAALWCCVFNPVGLSCGKMAFISRSVVDMERVVFSSLRSILDLVSVLLDLLVDGLDGWGVLDDPCGWDGVLLGDEGSGLQDWGGLDQWGGLEDWGLGDVLDWGSLDQWGLGWEGVVDEPVVGVEAGVQGEAVGSGQWEAKTVGVDWESSKTSVDWCSDGGHCVVQVVFG